MFRMALCDNEASIVESLQWHLHRLFRELGVGVHLDCFTDSSELIAQLALTDYDALFLDIDMPGTDGITIAYRQHLERYNSLVVFITGHDELVFKSFVAQPFRFVRKKNLLSELPEAAEALVQALESRSSDKILCGTQTSAVALEITRILYIESFDKKKKIILANRRLAVTNTMEYFEEQLKAYSFIRIHRSYLVNLKYVFSIEGEEVVMDNGDRLPVSRNRKSALKEAFWRTLK